MIVISKETLSPKTNEPETKAASPEISFDRKFLMIKNNAIEQYDSNANPEPTRVKLLGGEGSLPAKKEEPNVATLSQAAENYIAPTGGGIYEEEKSRKSEIAGMWYENPLIIGAIALVVGGLVVYFALKA